MNKQELVKAFAIATVALLGGLLLSTSIALASVPKANCGPGDRTESGLQGETTQEERFSGDSELGYNCNLKLVGQQPQGAFEGAFSQNGPAYFDHCAYYATEDDPLQQHPGVVVLDVSDPRHPRVTAYLDDNPAALNPHETLKVNEARKLLAVAESQGPGFAVYDLSADCRHPVLKASITLEGSSAHHGNFAPDGLTYYIGQQFRGIGGFLYIVDLTDPSNPQQLPTWQFLGDGRPHGVWLNPKGFARGVPEGTRLYAGQPGQFGQTPAQSSFGPDGLVILDVSDYQFRRPNPEIRIISTLFWEDQGQAEDMYPVKIKGHPYIISSDEAGGAGGVGGWAAACARGASAFGYPQIIDVGDETNPRIIAKLMLEVNDPANCSALLAVTPPDPPEPRPGRTCRPSRGRPTTAMKDVSLTIPTMRRCSLALFSMQACAFSTFAIPTTLKRSRTGSHRLCGRRSNPDQVAGQRASIEPWIRLLVTCAGSLPTRAKPR